MNYFYNGTLIGVNTECVLLQDPKIIYETGKFTDKNWSNIESLGFDELYVQKSSIESFAKTK